MSSSLTSWLMPLLLAAGCVALVMNIWSARKVASQLPLSLALLHARSCSATPSPCTSLPSQVDTVVLDTPLLLLFLLLLSHVLLIFLPLSLFLSCCPAPSTSPR